MGCCASNKATTDPLKPNTHQGHIGSRENAPWAVSKQQEKDLHANERLPVLEPIHIQEEPLNLSGKPGWKQPQFINYPEVSQIPVDNSPIHIIYSSDHESKEPTAYSTVKKNLFKNRPLENSVIQQVSQENADSYLAGSAQMSKQVKGEKPLGEPIQEEQIHIQVKEQSEVEKEEQIPSTFSFSLPRIQIFPTLAQA